MDAAGWAQIKAQSGGTLCSVCPCSAQFATLCARALFRNVQPHSAWPHSARPHSFGHAGVGPHSSPIIAQSGTRSVQCAHALLTRSVHALCSRALLRNVRPHSFRPHSVRPHSFGHAGVSPHSGPIIAQSGTLCSVCPCSAQFTRSVHALCSETFDRIMFDRIETVRMRPATTGTTSGQQHRAGSEAAMEAGTEGLSSTAPDVREIAGRSPVRLRVSHLPVARRPSFKRRRAASFPAVFCYKLTW